MPGVLDLVWDFKTATEAEPTPPAGQSNAIYRGDTYTHVFRFTNEDETPFVIEGDVSGQLRPARLSSATAAAPVAVFDVAVNANTITISLTPEQTLALPAATTLYWDLQVDNAGTVTTMVAGKVKVLDDVTREG